MWKERGRIGWFHNTFSTLGLCARNLLPNLEKGVENKEQNPDFKEVLYRIFRRINELCIYLWCAWHTAVAVGVTPFIVFSNTDPYTGMEMAQWLRCSYRGPSTHVRETTTCSSSSSDLTSCLLRHLHSCTCHMQAHTHT